MVKPPVHYDPTATTSHGSSSQSSWLPSAVAEAAQVDDNCGESKTTTTINPHNEALSTIDRSIHSPCTLSRDLSQRQQQSKDASDIHWQQQSEFGKTISSAARATAAAAPKAAADAMAAAAFYRQQVYLYERNLFERYILPTAASAAAATVAALQRRRVLSSSAAATSLLLVNGRRSSFIRHNRSQTDTSHSHAAAAPLMVDPNEPNSTSALVVAAHRRRKRHRKRKRPRRKGSAIRNTGEPTLTSAKLPSEPSQLVYKPTH